MAKHTPGPWNIDPVEALVASTKISIQFVAMLGDENNDFGNTWDDPSMTDEVMANARLIAAAPEMREKIEAALKEWDILPRGRAFTIAEITDWLTRYMAPAMDELRAAIAKAEGGN